MIADKSPVVRSGLRDFITRDGRFEVLDAHASGSAFIAGVEQHPTDIGIIGWSLPYIDLQALTTDPFAELTSRERELLTALANGWTNLQIASRIGISRNTVKYHLKNLYDKLGVSNRAMAVALYMQTTMDQR
jgi:DNA-binding NarL/FixJ family response regulator